MINCRNTFLYSIYQKFFMFSIKSFAEREEITKEENRLKCNIKFDLQKRILNNSVASWRCFSWKQENRVPLGRRPALASLGSLWSTGSCSLERLVSFSNKGKMRSDFSLMVIFENYIRAEERTERTGSTIQTRLCLDLECDKLQFPSPPLFIP